MERPSDLTYWMDERPPLVKLALLGLQHSVVSYKGSLVQTGSPKFSREPTEEQAFISGLSGYLNVVAADRVEPSVQDGKCQIKLTFTT